LSKLGVLEGEKLQGWYDMFKNGFVKS
jgi:hypothetical protein